MQQGVRSALTGRSTKSVSSNGVILDRKPVLDQNGARLLSISVVLPRWVQMFLLVRNSTKPANVLVQRSSLFSSVACLLPFPKLLDCFPGTQYILRSFQSHSEKGYESQQEFSFFLVSQDRFLGCYVG